SLASPVPPRLGRGLAPVPTAVTRLSTRQAHAGRKTNGARSRQPLSAVLSFTLGNSGRRLLAARPGTSVRRLTHLETKNGPGQPLIIELPLKTTERYYAGAECKSLWGHGPLAESFLGKDHYRGQQDGTGDPGY